MSQPMSNLLGIPEQIARYQLLSELGRGSMGHVYLALDPNIDRKVAIKIFLPLLKVGVAEQWELRQRFVLEARAAGQLNHPGIVTIFDADTDSDTGLSYLAMEWVRGPSLDELIRESGPLSIERSTKIVEEVALALDVAHRRGLVHRDIKPANILLENSGRAKVTDFGIAKLASMSITTTGWIPGSPFYMSPEQIRNENIDHRSDLYALGAVLYQCLTGSLPFEAESLAALTHMILEIDPRPVRSINRQVSADLAAVIDRALAKSPVDRFDSGTEFARALELAKEGRFISESGGIKAAGTAPKPRADATGGLAEDQGTGTIGLAAGLAAGPEPSAGDGEPAIQGALAEATREPAATRDAASRVPIDVVPRAGAGVRRSVVAMGVVVLLVAIWSLGPVVSEPTGGSPAGARLFAPAPRFLENVPTTDARLEVPAQPPEGEAAAEAGSPAIESASLPATPGASQSPPTSAKSQPTSAATSSRPAPAASPGRQPRTSTGNRPDPTRTAAREPAKPVAVPAPVVEGEPAGTTASATSPAIRRQAPAVAATSKLELVYRNRLKNAELSVFVDGRRAYRGSVASEAGFFSRAVGKNVWAAIDLTPGEHVVDVRITGAEGKLDLVRQTSARFEDGRTHRLRVSVSPFKKLRLAWKESPGG